jgi:hypothetical protein
LHPKAITEKAIGHPFFIGVFTGFEMPISGGSAKRQWHLYFFLGAHCMVFFFHGF